MPPHPRGVRRLFGGGAQVCAIHVDGSVGCWKPDPHVRSVEQEYGVEDSPREGSALVALRERKVLGLPPGNAVAGAADSSRGCVVMESGDVACWRYDERHPFGGDVRWPLATRSPIWPAEVVEVHAVAGVSVSAAYTLAWGRDGSAWSWGNRSLTSEVARENGLDAVGDPVLQLARSGRSDLSRPAPMRDLHGVKSMVAGGQHACALLNDGSVECWGREGLADFGQLGTTLTRTGGPVRVPNIVGATALSIGSHESCALVNGGQVWCWGLLMGPAEGADVCRFPSADFEGDPHPVRCAHHPVRIPLPAPAIALRSGPALDCIIDADQRPWCWGGHRWPESQMPATRLQGAALDLVALSDGACILNGEGDVLCYDFEGRSYNRPPEPVELAP